jgi:hypothetical protein
MRGLAVAHRGRRDPSQIRRAWCDSLSRAAGACVVVRTLVAGELAAALTSAACAGTDDAWAYHTPLLVEPGTISSEALLVSLLLWKSDFDRAMK